MVSEASVSGHLAPFFLGLWLRQHIMVEDCGGGKLLNEVGLVTAVTKLEEFISNDLKRGIIHPLWIGNVAQW
jgi:hypothetical protein